MKKKEKTPAELEFEQGLEFYRNGYYGKALDKLRELRKGAPKWSFVDGPITANNRCS